jgi:hypothetical protein
MRTRYAALALAAAVAFPAAAEAKLPSPSSKKIVPGRSIGGVKIGMTAEAAVKAWGKGGSCDETIGSSCTWKGTMKQGSARFSLAADGTVAEIRLDVGQKADYAPLYKGPITSFKTSKKIGIGSTLKKVVKAYPKAKPDGGGVTLRSGKRRTLFESSLGRVASITIDAAG